MVPEPDFDLEGAIERYLSDALDAQERSAFEARLKRDPEARRRLAERLAERGRGESPEEEPEANGRWWRSRGAEMAVAAALLVAGLGLGLYEVGFRDDPAGRTEEIKELELPLVSTDSTVPVDDETWARWFANIGRMSRRESLDLSKELKDLRRVDPGYLDRIREQEDIASLLALRDHGDRASDGTVLLLAILRDERTSKRAAEFESWPRKVVSPLRYASEPGFEPMFVRLLDTARDDEFCNRIAQQLVKWSGRTSQAEDWIEPRLERFLELRFSQTVCQLIRVAYSIDHDRLPEMCRRVLKQPPGALTMKAHNAAGNYLARTALEEYSDAELDVVFETDLVSVQAKVGFLQGAYYASVRRRDAEASSRWARRIYEHRASDDFWVRQTIYFVLESRAEVIEDAEVWSDFLVDPEPRLAKRAAQQFKKLGG